MQTLNPAWSRRKPHLTPYPWLVTSPGELFSFAVAEALAASFPIEGFTRLDASDRQRDKTYRNFSRTLVDPDTADSTPLSSPWQALVTDLRSGEYLRQVAALLGQPVARTSEIRFVRHSQGDWLSPHTDREDKLFSHILYFNPGWRPEWGGCLEILSDNDPRAVVGRVVPELGASALLGRQDNSWHQVSEVATRPVPDRLSLLVHGLG